MHRGAKMRTLCFVLSYFFFVGLLDYPYVSRVYNSYIQGKCITAYEASVKKTDDLSGAWEEARSYNQSLHTGVSGIRDAFAGKKDTEKRYLKTLSVNKDHTIGSLHIPEISLDLPIYHGTSEEVLQKGVGHLEGTSLPTGGKGTHTCLSAHRGLPDKRLFTNLDLLKKGDVFYMNVLDRKLAYEIFDIRTVRPDEISFLGIKEGRDLVTLITCTPYGINSHRLYVTGKRIAYRKITKKEEMPRENWWVLNWYLPVTAVLFIILLILLKVMNRKENFT